MRDRRREKGGKQGGGAHRQLNTEWRMDETVVEEGETVVEEGETVVEEGETVVEEGETVVEEGETVVEDGGDNSGG